MKIGCLSIKYADGQETKILLKNLSVFEAGRSQGNHICLKDDTVAMSHFRVYRNAQEYSVYDLGTKRGTQVNGQPVEKVALRPGDVIQAGDLEIVFDLVDDETPGRLASSAPDSSPM